jgi:tellurite resistance protein
MARLDPVDAIRIWAGVAWSDASLSSSERSSLEQLIRTSRVLDEEQRSLAAELLRPPASGGITTAQAMSAAGRLALAEQPLREEICRAALLLAQADGRLSSSEKTFLQRLRTELGLPQDLASTEGSGPVASRGVAAGEPPGAPEN